MKKRLSFSLILLTVLLGACKPQVSSEPSNLSETTISIASDESSLESSESSTPLTLDKVINIHVSGSFLRWDEVTNAVIYYLTIGEDVYSADSNAISLSTFNYDFIEPQSITISAKNGDVMGEPSDPFMLVQVDGVYYDYYESPYKIIYTNISLTESVLTWETKATYTNLSVSGTTNKVTTRSFDLKTLALGDGEYTVTLQGNYLGKDGDIYEVEVIIFNNNYFRFDENLEITTPLLALENNKLLISGVNLFTSFDITINTYTFNTSSLTINLGDYAPYATETPFEVKVVAKYQTRLTSAQSIIRLKYVDGDFYLENEPLRISFTTLNSSGVLSWKSVSGVTSYTVQIGHYLKTTTTPSFNLYNNRTHISNYTEIKVTGGDRSGTIYVSKNSSGQISQAFDPMPKLNTPSNAKIETDVYSAYLTYDRVSNDYPGTSTQSAFYVFYYNNGYDYVLSSPSPADTRVSVNLGALSSWFNAEQTIKIVAIGHSTYMNSDPYTLTIRKVAENNFVIV